MLFHRKDRKDLKVEPIRKVHKANYGGMANGVALLGVCKVVNEEAAAILYGRGTLCFDDSSRGVEGEKINECSITSLYIWLRLIGAENRARIRNLQIKISKFRFCYYDNESIPGTRAETNGGKYLGDAFELLSHNHRLRKITIILANESLRSVLPAHFFRPIETSRLLQQLQKVKGLKDFSCTMKDPQGSAKLIYQNLKQEMTQPKPQKEKARSGNVADTKAQNIGKRLAGIAERRTELQERIAAANAQIEEWKVLQARIEETSHQVSQWQEETKVIDGALEALDSLSSEVMTRVVALKDFST